MSRIKMSEIPDSMVFTIYEWFQSAMRRHGRKVSWPKCKDVKKTYQYRAIHKYTQKCSDELELDNKVIKILTYNIVDYAKRKGLLAKGAQMLCMDLVVDLCYQSIKDMIEDESSLMLEISCCHSFIADQVDSKDNLVRLMVEPISDGGYSRIVYWYNLGYITPLYVAISKKCIKALSKIPQSERQELPNDIELFRICTHTVSSDTVEGLKEILGADLRVPPTCLRS